MSAGPIRVLLADADPLQREGWRLLVDAQPDLRVVGEVPDGVQALAHLRRNAVDVALVDVRMPRLSGIELVPRLRADAQVRLAQAAGAPAVVLVTATDLDRLGPRGLAAGAESVLWKGAEPEALLAAVRDAAAAVPP